MEFTPEFLFLCGGGLVVLPQIFEYFQKKRLRSYMVQNCFNKLSTTLHPGRSQNSPIKLRTIPLAITTELRMKVYVMRDTDMFVRESPFPIPFGILYLWYSGVVPDYQKLVQPIRTFHV